jgi:hypothetical protein
VFVTVSHFHTGLIFASKVRSLPLRRSPVNAPSFPSYIRIG